MIQPLNSQLLLSGNKVNKISKKNLSSVAKNIEFTVDKYYTITNNSI